LEQVLIIILGLACVAGFTISMCVLRLQKQVAAHDRIIGQLMVFHDKTK
jgi:hypothetical protein